jgi:biotin carboxyl carrier protein
MKYLTTVNNQTFEIEINEAGRLTVNGQERTVDFQMIREALFSALLDNRSIEAIVEERDGRYQVLMAGDLYEVDVMDEREQRLLRASVGTNVSQGEFEVRAPMPGLIIAIRVAAGDKIEKGTTLCVLESMKMENEIKSPREGTVERVHVAKGDSVEQNKVLFTLA